MNDYLIFNKVLVSSILALFIAQTMKVFILAHKEKKFRWGLYSLPGNFPSSHSAVVSALATGVAITEGIDSAIFAVAVIFAFFIIYDAKVIRGAAGKQAQSLNKIIENQLKMPPNKKEENNDGGGMVIKKNNKTRNKALASKPNVHSVPGLEMASR